MGLFSKYENAGPGVSKNPDDKLPVFKFFGLYFSHISRLIMLNFLYIVAFLPFAAVMLVEHYFGGNTAVYYVAFYTAFIVFGGMVFGPATCGFTKIVRNISCERPVFLWHDFWKAYKSNFKQGWVMGMIDMAFIAAMAAAFPMYYSLLEQSNIFYIPFIICLVCSFIFLAMHSYIYLLIVSTNLGLWKILKNSFFLTSIEIKISVINLVVTVAIFLFMMVFFPFTAFMLVVVPSFLGLLYAYNCFPLIRKYVIQPWYDQRGEQNPEFEYKNTDGEAIFTDTPETEVPVEQPKEKSRKKQIR